MPRLNSDLYRTLVLTILAGLALMVTGLANRDVYSKEVIDQKFESMTQYEDERHRIIERDVGDIKSDVQWMVRQMGGKDADAE